MSSDLDALALRYRRTAEQVKSETAVPPGTPPVVVEVTSLPARRPWIFRITRDSEGKVESILAEPLP